MTAIFIANVGSRDIQVDGHANLPKDSRTLGEMLLNEYEHFRPSLRFPILGKSLDTVVKKEQQNLKKIILLASDQSSVQYRHTDTLPFAQLVERYIAETYQQKSGPVPPDALEIVTVRENPSDYDAMMRFYAETLALLPEHDTVYLAVTGGTPAMSFMLLWQGVQQFGVKAVPLYVTQERALPNTLNIGQSLVVDALRKSFLRAVYVYEYVAAKAILDDNQLILEQAWAPWRVNVLQRLTGYARDRYNFNFDQAFASLMGSDLGVAPGIQEQIHVLANDLASRDSLWLLNEEFIGTILDFERGGYKDAVINVFAFYESTYRQIAIQSGVLLIDDDRKVDGNWVDSIDGLRDYLISKNIDLGRNVTTFVFERILAHLAKKKLLEPRVMDLANKLEQIKKLADLRNRATHGHAGVSLSMVEQANGGPTSMLLQTLSGIFEATAGRSVSPYDYRYVNHLIEDVLEAAP